MSHVRRAHCVRRRADGARSSRSRSPRGSRTAGDRVAAAASAVSWLTTQQQSDGGFELAAFPGFETRDAIARHRRATPRPEASWSTSEAVDAVEAVQFGGGPAPSMPLDAYAQTISTPRSTDCGHRGEEHRARCEPARARPERLRPCRRRHAGRPGEPDGRLFRHGRLDVQLHALHRPRPEPRVRLAASATALNSACATRSRRTVGGTSTATRRRPTSIPTRPRLAVQALVAGGADATDPAVHAALGLLRRQPADQRRVAVVRRRRPELHVALDPRDHRGGVRRRVAPAGATPPTRHWRGTAVRGPDRAGCARSSSPRRRRRGPHREPQRQLRREHVRHVADGRGPPAVVAPDRAGGRRRPARRRHPRRPSSRCGTRAGRGDARRFTG